MSAIANTGNNATRLTTSLPAGELFYTTDTGLTYIGSNGSNGGQLINSTLLNTAVGNDAQIQWAYQGYLNSSPAFTWTGTNGLNVSPVSGIGGNVTANYFVGNFAGNGSQLTGIAASTLAGPLGNIVITGNITGGNANIQRSIAIGNNLTVFGNLQANGAANFVGLVQMYSDLTLVSDGLGNNVGNVTAGYFIGNGALLTGIVSSYSNANVSAYLQSGDYLGNYTGVGVSVTGNVSANYFIGNGSQLTGISGGNYTDANVANYLPTYTGNIGNLSFASSTLYSITGNSAYIKLGGDQDTRIGSDLGDFEIWTAGGTIWNYGANGNITLPSNSSAINYANGVSILAGLAGNYTDANVAAYLPTYGGDLQANTVTANAITTTGSSGNISGVDTITANTVVAQQQMIVPTYANTTAANTALGIGNLVAGSVIFTTDSPATFYGWDGSAWLPLS